MLGHGLNARRIARADYFPGNISIVAANEHPVRRVASSAELWTAVLVLFVSMIVSVVSCYFLLRERVAVVETKVELLLQGKTVSQAMKPR